MAKRETPVFVITGKQHHEFIAAFRSYKAAEAARKQMSNPDDYWVDDSDRLWSMEDVLNPKTNRQYPWM